MATKQFARHTDRISDKLTFHFWAAFDLNGNARFSRGRMALKSGERAMKLKVTIPKAVFSTPELSADIEITGNSSKDFSKNLKVEAERALSTAIGCEVVVTVKDGDE